MNYGNLQATTMRIFFSLSHAINSHKRNTHSEKPITASPNYTQESNYKTTPSDTNEYNPTTTRSTLCDLYIQNIVTSVHQAQKYMIAKQITKTKPKEPLTKSANKKGIIYQLWPQGLPNLI